VKRFTEVFCFLYILYNLFVNDNWETELSFAGDIKGVKSVGKNALKGIHAKATIKVPKAKLDKYKKVFKGKGQGKNVKVKKA